MKFLSGNLCPFLETRRGIEFGPKETGFNEKTIHFALNFNEDYFDHDYQNRQAALYKYYIYQPHKKLSNYYSMRVNQIDEHNNIFSVEVRSP